MRLPGGLRALTAGVALWAAVAAALAEDYFFRSPSGNIHCAWDDYSGAARVRCDIRSYTPTGAPRPAGCDLEWGDSYMVGAGDAKGSMVCHGDTVMSDRAKVLGYGKSWSKGGITCASQQAGLTCRTRKGHGFMLSKARQRVF